MSGAPYSDGAGALVLTSREKAEALGLLILAAGGRNTILARTPPAGQLVLSFV
jgi:acetyl-CoA acetyltransferase